jgi:uncharacterized protein YoxC
MKNFSQNENVRVVNACSYSTSIFAGILAALTVELLLGLLGMSIGLSLFSPTKGTLYTLSIGTVLWLFFSTLASMYVGGWAGGYFSPARTERNGILNGFMVSAVSAFILLALTLSGIGTLVGSTFSGLQYALSATKESTSTIATAVKGVSKLSPELGEKAKKAIPSLKPITDKINEKVAELLPEGDEASLPKVKADLEKIMASYLNSIDGSNSEAAKEKLVSALAKATGKTSVEINEKIEEWKKDYSEAKEKAYQQMVEVSEDAAKAVSKFALLNFFILISGIIAGMMGGLNGVRRDYNS